MKWTMIIMALCLAGCSSTTLAPLSEPETRQLDVTTTYSSGTYTIPTYKVWACPVHGEIGEALLIEGKTYCPECAWKKALDIR